MNGWWACFIGPLLAVFCQGSDTRLTDSWKPLAYWPMLAEPVLRYAAPADMSGRCAQQAVQAVPGAAGRLGWAPLCRCRPPGPLCCHFSPNFTFTYSPALW